jgi:hypothetical protein
MGKMPVLKNADLVSTSSGTAARRVLLVARRLADVPVAARPKEQDRKLLRERLSTSGSKTGAEN